MKRIITLLTVFVFAITCWSQTMTINFKDGNKVQYKMGDVESVEFTNENTSPSSFLVGTWKTTFVEGWGQEVNVNDPDYLQLQDNGNYVHVEWENNAPYISYGRWSYSNDKLTLKETEGDLKGSSFVYDIVKVETDKITVTLMGATATLIRVSDSVIEKYLNNYINQCRCYSLMDSTFFLLTTCIFHRFFVPLSQKQYGDAS